MTVTGHCSFGSVNQCLVRSPFSQKRPPLTRGRVRSSDNCCRARQEDREKGGIDWDAEWSKAKQSECFNSDILHSELFTPDMLSACQIKTFTGMC